jgi:hypothetical protein
MTGGSGKEILWRYDPERAMIRCSTRVNRITLLLLPDLWRMDAVTVGALNRCALPFLCPATHNTEPVDCNGPP